MRDFTRSNVIILSERPAAETYKMDRMRDQRGDERGGGQFQKKGRKLEKWGDVGRLEKRGGGLVGERRRGVGKMGLKE